MKKFLLSFAIIVAFIGYGFWDELTQNTVPATAPTPVSVPTPAPASTPVSQGKFRDGEYLGTEEDVYYGILQVKAVVVNGKLDDVVWLSYPNDRETSLEKSYGAMPILKQEAIAAQSAQVDIVSGATETSLGFQRSLAAALAKAQ